MTSPFRESRVRRGVPVPVLCLITAAILVFQGGVAVASADEELPPSAKAELEKFRKGMEKATLEFNVKIEESREKCAAELARLGAVELKNTNVNTADQIMRQRTDLERVLDDGTEKFEPTDHHLRLLDAIYGGGDHWVDVAPIMRRLVRNDAIVLAAAFWENQRRLNDANNTKVYFSDPQSNGSHSLILDYSFNGSKFRQIFRENRPIHIPLELP